MFFVKQYSPCKAFEIAKEEVKRVNCAAEANKFILLTCDEGKNKEHSCKPLVNFQPGEFTELDQTSAVYNVPASVSNLKGRQREMYDLMRLLHQSKIVNLYGLPGMGKTCLLKNICNHAKHRNKFEDGIIFIDLDDAKTYENFFEILSI